MTETDHLFAAAYPKHLARSKDTLRRAQLSARRRRMNGGKKLALDTVKRLQRELEAAGLSGVSRMSLHEKI